LFRFHHTSFLAGEACIAAGTLFIRQGRLTRVDPHSGHYRPGSAELYKLLSYFVKHRVQLGTIQVDMQRVMKVVRDKRKKKVESPLLWRGDHSVFFLTHKLMCARTFNIELKHATYKRALRKPIKVPESAELLMNSHKTKVRPAQLQQTDLSPVDTQKVNRFHEHNTTFLPLVRWYSVAVVVAVISVAVSVWRVL
jgi:hypothetical protein